MQTYELLVQNRAVKPNSADMTLVRTSVGIDQVHILFDSDEWLEFPITITFSSATHSVTQSIVVSSTDSSEWVAESTVTVPWEVVRETGPIRVTIQGTDSQGRHIITAAGAPLSVEESGDEDSGEIPSDAPTVDQWQQAYANAITAANQAASAASDLQSQIGAIVSRAESSLDEKIASLDEPATTERLGPIKVGYGLEISEEGVLRVTSLEGLTSAQAMQLANLARLAYHCFDTSFDADGILESGAMVKSSALPIADTSNPGMVMPDGTSVTVDSHGIMHFVGGLVHSWDGSVLTVTSSDGTSSADLAGPVTEITSVTASADGTSENPSVVVTKTGSGNRIALDFAFSGLKGDKGDRGPQGPSGYVLTDEDIETISDEILARYGVLDGTRY